MGGEVQLSNLSVPQSSDMDGGVLPTLLRYRDRHQWSWNLSTRLINLYYGTNYTEKQLKAMYKTHGA